LTAAFSIRGTIWSIPTIRVGSVYLGLSGGIGSGKSTVAKILTDLGAVVIDADVIAREVLEPGRIGYENTILTFGDSVLTESGSIDRKKLAEQVFQNPVQLAKLEAIIHPAVIDRVTQIRESLPETSTVVYDTPLMFEKQLQSQFDKVLIVSADTELRRSRLLDRGLELNDINARMANQATDDQRESIADFVIQNNGSLAQLQEQVAKVWLQISA
jgi:dephospho-CoA kinase